MARLSRKLFVEGFEVLCPVAIFPSSINSSGQLLDKWPNDKSGNIHIFKGTKLHLRMHTSTNGEGCPGTTTALPMAG